MPTAFILTISISFSSPKSYLAIKPITKTVRREITIKTEPNSKLSLPAFDTFMVIERMN